MRPARPVARLCLLIGRRARRSPLRRLYRLGRSPGLKPIARLGAPRSRSLLAQLDAERDDIGGLPGGLMPVQPHRQALERARIDFGDQFAHPFELALEQAPAVFVVDPEEARDIAL